VSFVDHFFWLLLLSSLILGITSPALAADPDLAVTVQRPLRYRPQGTDFVIDNGEHWFNRPLYGPHTVFHTDGGDKPEFALVNGATKDGVLRLAISTPGGQKWLADAAHITTRYRPGSLIYDIQDPLLGNATLHLIAQSQADREGLILQASISGSANSAELIYVYGGVNSFQRNAANVAAGDVITQTNVTAVRQIDENNGSELRPRLMLQESQCGGDVIAVEGSTFTIRAGSEMTAGCASADVRLSVGDASKMDSLADLLASTAGQLPLVVGRTSLAGPTYLAIWRGTPTTTALSSDDLAKQFDAAEAHRREVADMIIVDTPDPFINAIPGAMAIAADGCWQPPVWMHGAVSWRTTLLGWRGPYMADGIGWHDRAVDYLNYWAGRQNTADDFPTVATPNPARGLSENDGKMLHSNGSIPQTHYDMNLPYIDVLFRHLLWTGDVELARQLWPTIQRHLAWEKRLFDRDGLYEGYACIWASDALQYNGGGAAHSTAYNEFHNRMAARVARWIGADPAPYEKEAERIHAAMQSKLWMPSLGWYAEYLDVMGEKQLHPAAALWTIYHSVDSRVPDAFQAWQCMRYVDTSIAHIPVRGPGLPAGDYAVLPSSNWMPYEWSLNNVVTAEDTHTALAYWQAGRPGAGFNLLKSQMLDTMYMGMTPGNIPNLSVYDPYRGESYTDFGDPIGITSRAFTEGLFGIQPNAMDGELVIRPGFPTSWDHASITRQDVAYQFQQTGQSESWNVRMKFPKPMKLRLQLPARGEGVELVTINGASANWKNLDDSIGMPWIEVAADAPAATYEVDVKWRGAEPAHSTPATAVDAGAKMRVALAPASLVDVFDPQNTLGNIQKSANGLSFTASGVAGHRTAFAKVTQGELTWWQPIEFEIRAPVSPVLAAPPTAGAHWDMVDLSSQFNDKVTQIFRNDYLSPRPRTCSLQMPIHGIGDWTGPTKTYNVDDSGLRRAAGAAGKWTTPNGVPFKTPGDANAKNIAFTSQWDNYPRRMEFPLSGKAEHAYFLMAGSTNAMESQIDNGELIVDYADGSSDRLALHNPTNWWPIDKNYRIDDYAFRRPGPVPLRVALATGAAYMPERESSPRGGSATVLDMPLDSARELKSLTLHTESYEIVIGMMSVTLQRP
jgi:hypothetical protein